ncbi:unnamed protein product [Phaeothamnion confervicola]
MARDVAPSLAAEPIFPAATSSEDDSLVQLVCQQLVEADLLEAAFPEICWIEPDVRNLLAEISSSGDDPAAANALLAMVPDISFRLPVLDGAAGIRARMPRCYPQEALRVEVEPAAAVPPFVRRAVADAVAAAAATAAAAAGSDGGCCCAMAVLQAADRALEDALGPALEAGATAIADSAMHEHAVAATAVDSDSVADSAAAAAYPSAAVPVERKRGPRLPGGPSSPSATQPSSFWLGRRLIYFHHIICPAKRAAIRGAAAALRLGGYCKIGWPGIIIIEGAEDDCRQFVAHLQRFRWKHMVVRGEETIQLPLQPPSGPNQRPQDRPEGIPGGGSSSNGCNGGGSSGRGGGFGGSDAAVDAARCLHHGFEEMGERDMAVLAERCRAAGCHDLFLTSMKVYGRTEAGTKTDGGDRRNRKGAQNGTGSPATAVAVTTAAHGGGGGSGSGGGGAKAQRERQPQGRRSHGGGGGSDGCDAVGSGKPPSDRSGAAAIDTKIAHFAAYGSV